MTETLKSNLLASEGKKEEKEKGGKKSQVQLTASREDRIELSSPETWETVPLIAPADLIVSRTEFEFNVISLMSRIVFPRLIHRLSGSIGSCRLSS